MLTWSTAGESHGPALIALMEGLPSGVPITTEKLREALAQRRQGYGRGARQKFERDEVRILSGVRHGLTTGAPVAVEIANSEWPKWEIVMSADPVAPEDLLVDAGKGDTRELARNRPLTAPRPGHADLAGMVSYNLSDARNVLERASARETAARVVLGTLAREFLAAVSDVAVVSHVVAVGNSRSEKSVLPRPEDTEALNASDIRTLDQEDAESFRSVIDIAQGNGDTVGGVAEVVAWNVPIGLGTHVNETGKLDARLAAALMSLQSVKAVEIGDGFAQAASFGSQAHDEILKDGDDIIRASNRAGGIEGGTANGQPIVVRAAFKPISTVPRALRTIDLADGSESTAFHQRSDTCQIVPGAFIAESQVCLQLAAALTERCGGRSVAEVQAQVDWLGAHAASFLGGHHE